MRAIAYLRRRIGRFRTSTPVQAPPPRSTVRSREELHAHWRDPDGLNRPADYLEPTARSQFLLGFVEPYLTPGARILEIGCNVGRNLAHLFEAGHRDLTGIEINTAALALLRESFPELGQTATLIGAPVEDVIRDLPDASFDMVFAMAVLEHIHPDSEWIFGEMVRISRSVVVTIEDEHGTSRHHVPRDYRAVFEGHGMRQLAEQDVSAAEGFPTDFRARIFGKAGPVA